MLSEQGKKWVRYNMKKHFELIFIVEACGLINIGFSGQRFTWCNQRCIAQKIMKRLVKAVVNDTWIESMPQTTITHLPSTRSHHSRHLMELIAIDKDYTKYHKFLNCWVDNPSFMNTVKTFWEREVEGNVIWKFHKELIRLANTWRKWSK